MCLFSRIKIFQIGQIFQINDPPNRRTTNLNKDLPLTPASLICQRELIAPKICVVVSFNLRNHLDYASTRNRFRDTPQRERIFLDSLPYFF